MTRVKPKVSDLTWMARALELASQPAYTAPNPHVGCVIVRDGDCVGEGDSEPAGGRHAEIVALEQAGLRARGATAYVTLEPCNHQGRTGPCATALVEAGIKRVCFAVADPNRQAGGGASTLIQAGVEVEAGLMADEAEKIHAQFLFAHRNQRPLVALKVAMTLDGRVAWPDGRSKWITGEEARARARLLRAEYGAVIVGSGTVLADNPALTVRSKAVVNEPLRVVLDRSGRLKGDEAVFHEPGRNLWLVSEPSLPTQTSCGDWSPEAIAKRVWQEGCTGLMVEGGPATWSAFLKAGLYDRLDLFVAPVVFGDGLTWAMHSLAPEGLRMPGAPEVTEIGRDLWLRYRRTV